MLASLVAVDGRADDSAEALARGSYVVLGSWNISWEMTDPSSTVSRSSRLRLLERIDASDRERSRRARKPVIEWGDAPRLRLDSDPSRLLLRVNAATRDRTDGRSAATLGEL